MRYYNAEERQRFAEILSDLANEWIIRKEADFEIEIQRGVHWCRNAATGNPTPRPNPTITLTLTINGGVQDTEGGPIVRSPGLFDKPID